MGASVADIGFGGGLSLSLLLETLGPKGEVIGAEVSLVALQRAEREFRNDISAGRLRLHHAPIESLPLRDGSLNGVMSMNTLYFVEHLDPALRELVRVVRRDGRVVLGLGDPDAMATLSFTPHGFRLRPIAEVVQAMAEVGLNVVKHERVGDGQDAYHLLLAHPEAVAKA
jgi:ubiquinone/menaquinone biosynthesis C-methylase UbiE